MRLKKEDIFELHNNTQKLNYIKGPYQPKGNYDYVRKIKKQMIPSSPQTVEGTKLKLCTLFSWRASRSQLGQNYVLHELYW